MKLFRIATDPQLFDDAIDADIINNFQEDVYIEPYSRIGLKSLACHFTDDRIDIGTNNNTFSVRAHSRIGLLDVTIPVGLYDIYSLGRAVERAINVALGNAYFATGQAPARVGLFALGFQFRVDAEWQDGKMKIEWRRGEPHNDNVVTNTHNMIADADGFYQKTENSSQGLFDGFIASAHTTNCFGRVDFGIRDYADGEEVLVGLRFVHPNDDILPNDANPLLDHTKYHLCLSSSNDTLTVGIDGVLSSDPLNDFPGFAPGDNTLSIFFKPGGFHFTLNDGNPFGSTNVDIFHDIFRLYNGAHACASLLRKGVHTKVKVLGFSPNPWNLNDGVNTITEYNNDNMEHQNGNLMLDDVRATNVQLVFPDLFTSNTYGYKHLLYSRRSIGSYFLSENYVDTYWAQYLGLTVMLLNPSISSYDGYTGRRRNILLDLPIYHNSDDSNIVQYVTEQPLMIDINNREQIRLSHIHVRLLDRFGNVLKLKNNGGVMTLVIDGPK